MVVAIATLMLAVLAPFVPEEKQYSPRLKCAKPAQLGLNGPEVRSLDGTWKLAKVEVAKSAFPEDPTAAELPRKDESFDDSEWSDQYVPYDLYCCNAYPKRKNQWPNIDFPYSCAWYRRTFELTESEAKGAVYLHFGAIAWKAIVYLNGKEIGRHHGEFTAFDLKATGFVKAGTNTLAIRVLSDLGPRATNGIIKEADHPYGCQWWIATYRGGITESIDLVINRNAAFESIRTTPRVDDGILEVDWKASEALDGCELEAVIVDAVKGGDFGKAKLTAQGDAGTLKIPVAKSIQLWEIGDAHLYYVNLIAKKDGKEVASGVSRFGWRKVEVKNGGFYLNNRRRFLFGANINSIDYLHYGDPSKPAMLERMETDEKIETRNGSVVKIATKSQPSV